MNTLSRSRLVRHVTLAPLPHPLAVLLAWNARHRMRRDLARLDPHLLRDIGLTEGQALAESRKPFWAD